MKPERSEFILKRMSLVSQPLNPPSRVKFSTDTISEVNQLRPPNFLVARNSLITKRVEFLNQGNFYHIWLFKK